MKKLAIFGAALALGLASAASAQQTVLFEDDFESYSDLAGVLAAAKWTSSEGTPGIATDQNVTPSGSKSLSEPNSGNPVTGPRHRLFGEFAPVEHSTLSASNPLKVTVYLRTNLVGASYRSGLSLTGTSVPATAFGGTDGTLDQLLALAPYHSTSTTHFSRRVAFGADNWQPTQISLTGAADTWHKLTIEITDASITFNVNDSATPSVVNAFTAPGKWQFIRLGEMAGGSGNTADIWYDDIKVTLGPDPVSNVDDWHLMPY